MPTPYVSHNYDDQPLADRADLIDQVPVLDSHYILAIHHASLEQDAIGRLGTHAPLLICAGKIGQCLASENPRPALFGGVVSTNGRYEQDLRWDQVPQCRLLGGDDAAELLIRTLSEHCEQLSANAALTPPLSHRALHVSDARLRTLEELAEVRSLGGRVTLRRSAEGGEMDLPLPQKEHLDAMPKNPRDARRVVGVLTGVGLEGNNSCRVEVNRGKPMIVESLSLLEACRLLQAGARITGTRVDVNGDAHLRAITLETEQGVLNI